MAQAKAWIGEKYADRFDSRAVHSQVRGSCLNVASAYTRKERKDAPKILSYSKAGRIYQLATPGAANEAALRVSFRGGLPNQNMDSERKRVEEQATFVLESHLRDYLVRNLHILESGLELWAMQPPSVEYLVDGKFIDILAKDATGIPVVIELKVKRGYDRVVGQALLYRTLVENKLGVDRVRLMLIASEISEELKLATKHVLDVDLFEYKLSMLVSLVGQNQMVRR